MMNKTVRLSRSPTSHVSPTRPGGGSDSSCLHPTIHKSWCSRFNWSRSGIGSETKTAVCRALVGPRNDILAADNRCLYLASLKALTLRDLDSQADMAEAPVPASLGKLTPGLDHFAAYYDVDPRLISSAAAASLAKSDAISNSVLRKAIG